MAKKDKILIVDDEQINLDFFDVMLSKLGFAVETAEDGEEALEKVKETSPDLIILDNIMPRLTGWEVTKIIKNEPEYEQHRHVPIIMFSAMDDVKDKIEGFELGIEDYITKPFNFSEVLARIKAVLRSRDLSQQILQRERRIEVVESLNRSLVHFASQLKKPIRDLLDASTELDTSDANRVKEFIAQVARENKATVAALDALEDEIRELEGKGDRIKAEEITLDDLEEKYQKHFDTYRERVPKQ
ncbi:MAG TPA: response regulator [Spirochaetia bacterium]|nr:response regulator [Spirochaetia bacterium]